MFSHETPQRNRKRRRSPAGVARRGSPRRSHLIALLAAITILWGCGGGDGEHRERIEELRAMPVQFEATVCEAFEGQGWFSNMADPFRTLMGDRSEYYVPSSVFAYDKRYEEDGEVATIALGDKVSVLQKHSLEDDTGYLVRTDWDTYTWLLPYNLCDDSGARLAELPD